MRHLLLDKLTENTHQVEDGEHLVLQALDGLGGVEEDETDEERHGAAEDQLGVDVGRRAPVLLEHAARDDLKLAPERRGELLDRLRLGRAAGRRAGQGARLEVLQLGLHRLVLLALEPCLVPVDLGGGAGGGANGGKHPLGRVLSVVAGRRTVLLKVVDQGLRVLANVAKVDGSSTLGQEKQAIEALEQHGGRLVNGAKDGLAGLGKLFEEVEDGPRGLRVESRGRFINEQQQRRLRSELNADGETLSLFHVETFAKNTYGDRSVSMSKEHSRYNIARGENLIHTNNSIGVFLHIQKSNDLVHVCQLLGLGGASGLAQQGRELESFSHSAGLEVQVLLLNVTGFALEGLVANLAVDEHLARDHTHGDTISETVEKCGLAGSGDSHERCERARLDPTVNVVQNSAGFALDLNVVAKLAPVEGASGTLNGSLGVGTAAFFVVNHGARSSSVGLGIGGALGGRRLMAAAEHEDFAL